MKPTKSFRLDRFMLREFFKAVNRRDLDKALEIADALSTGVIGGMGPEVKIDWDDDGVPLLVNPSASPRDRQLALLAHDAVALHSCVEGCREAVESEDAKTAALEGIAVGLSMKLDHFQELLDRDQDVSGGKARAQKQAEAAGPMKKAAREIRREITSKLSLTAQAQYVRKKLIERQKSGELDGEIPMEKTLRDWSRADDKRH